MPADGLIWATSHYKLASGNGWHNAKPTDLPQWFMLPCGHLGWSPQVLLQRKEWEGQPRTGSCVVREVEGLGTETTQGQFILNFLDSYQPESVGENPGLWNKIYSHNFLYFTETALGGCSWARVCNRFKVKVAVGSGQRQQEAGSREWMAVVMSLGSEPDGVDVKATQLLTAYEALSHYLCFCASFPYGN